MKVKDITAMGLFWIILLGVLSALTAYEVLGTLADLLWGIL